MPKIRPIEIFLIEFIIYCSLWLWDDYIASLLTLVFTSILIFLFIISLLAELIEPSKVPRWYYYFMGISILAPITAALVFVLIMEFDFEWLSIGI